MSVGVVLIVNYCRTAMPTVGSIIPKQVVTDYIRMMAKCKLVCNPASKEHPFCFSCTSLAVKWVCWSLYRIASRPVFKCLPWVHALTSFNGELWPGNASLKTPFRPKLAFGQNGLSLQNQDTSCHLRLTGLDHMNASMHTCLQTLLLHESVCGYHHCSPASFNISCIKNIIKISSLLNHLH